MEGGESNCIFIHDLEEGTSYTHMLFTLDWEEALQRCEYRVLDMSPENKTNTP